MPLPAARFRPAVQALDDRIVPAAPTLLNPTPLTLPGAQSAWDYSDGGSFTPSPVFADVDGQPGEELITVTGARTVVAYKWGGNGDNGPVFTPVRTFSAGANAPEFHASPLVLNLPGVGPAVFAGGMDGRVFGWNATTGALLPGWPATVDVPDSLYPLGNQDNRILGHLGAGDLDGDGVPEVIALSLSQHVTAFGANGSLRWRFSNDDSVLSGVAVGDLDRDGKAEVVFRGDSSQNAVYDAGGFITALTGDGRRKWVKKLDQVGQSAPVLADVNGDGTLEVFAGTGINFTNLNGVPFPGNKVYGLDADGNDLPGWPYITGPGTRDFRTPSPPTVADLNADGVLEIVIGDYSGRLHAIRPNGTALWVTQAYPDPLVAAPAIADVTGDGMLDVVQLANVRVRAFDGATGRQNYEYIDLTNTAQYMNSPAVGQFKGDGTTQLAILSNGLANPPRSPSAVRFFDLPATTVAPAWSAARRDAAANAVVRTPAFALDYLAGIGTYFGRDVAGANALAAAFQPRLQREASLTPLTAALIASPEARFNEIRRWYTQYLDRTADAGGLNAWLGFLNAGNSFAAGQAEILGSQEAFNKSGPTGPASATNATWVTYLYQRVLGRTPAANEQAGWVNALNAGQISRPAVARGFLLSVEFTQATVRRWVSQYRLHGGAPSPETLAAASWDLRRGVLEETVLTRLFTQGRTATSLDYLRTHPEGSWLQALYQDVLRRPLRSSDAVFWLNQFEAGQTYTSIASAVVNSAERNTLLVQDYFVLYLKRPTPPTAGEVAGFVSRLTSGGSRESVVADIVGSNEYYNRAGGTVDGFIFAAYADILSPDGTVPDATSLAYWRSRPNRRAELPAALQVTDQYRFNAIKVMFYAALRRYPNTPSNLSSLLNPIPPGSDSYPSVRPFINFLNAGGQLATIEVTVLTSPEYLAIAQTRAFWLGTRWKV